MKKYIRSTTTDTRIPDTMPTKSELLTMIHSLRGSELSDAIDRLDSLGSFYREDKRQKRQYLVEVVENNFMDDPADDYYPSDAVQTNRKLIYVVTGVPYYNSEFSQRFGTYDMDKLYERARN